MNHSPIPEEELKNIFTYHPPHADQPKLYQDIRAFAYTFAIMLNQECPPSNELNHAIYHLQETVFWANAAIARHPIPQPKNE